VAVLTRIYFAITAFRLACCVLPNKNILPSFQNNVTEKVTSMKFQLSDIETRAEKMREIVTYQKLKESLYGALEILRKILSDNQDYISNLNLLLQNVGQNVDVLVDECVVRHTTFESQASKIDELRRLANDATLHPGVFSDPSNSIKCDLFNFCESWQKLDNDFSEMLDKLRQAKKQQQQQRAVEQKPRIIEFFVDEIDRMEENFRRLQSDVGVDRTLLAEFESLLASVRQFNEEVEGLSVW
jgi:hypothetical protein